MTRLRVALATFALATALGVSVASAATTPAAPAAPATRGPSPRMTAPPMVLPFIDDDYDRALAEARRLKIPIFIEAWAPW